MRSHYFTHFVLLVGITLMACSGDETRMPKQRMFPFVDYPVKKDTSFAHGECPFSFTFPSYLVYRQDSFFFGEKPVNDCWFDLNSQALGASLHCSYYPVNGRADLDRHIEDAFTITGKHNIKANARKETLISGQKGVNGIFFEVDGPVASPIQFFLTDSTHHFFRASLYFNATVNPDSTAPVLQFIRKDIEKIISAFEWNK